MSNTAQWEFRRGRQDEMEKTGTGEATIKVHDFDGLYDPTNASSPYWGQLDGAPVSLSLHNPVTDTWHTRFTGYVEEYTYELSRSQLNQVVEIHAVDGFDYLAQAEMTAGIHGFLPLPAGVNAGNVFYEDAEVDERIHGLLDDANWPAMRRRIFSGNVVVQECVYDSGYSFLAALGDAADAEFPGVANVYMDGEGYVVFHGRHARFDPDTVAAGAGSAWDFTRWKVGDGAAITGDPTYAQLRPPLFSDNTLKNVINAALIYPAKTTESDDIYEANIEINLSTNTSSLAFFGPKSYTAAEIRTLRHKTNGNDGWDEAFAMGQYYTQNYGFPRFRPRAITVKSVEPDDPRAAATWAFLCGVEISDVIHLKVGHPGGGGVDEDFYVEGITTTCEPLNPEYDLVTVTCDVSPAAYWTEDSMFPDG